MHQNLHQYNFSFFIKFFFENLLYVNLYYFEFIFIIVLLQLFMLKIISCFIMIDGSWSQWIFNCLLLPKGRVKKYCTISYFNASFYFLSLSIDIFCFFMKFIVYYAKYFLSAQRLRNFFCCQNSFYCFFLNYYWSRSQSPIIF